LRPDTTNEQAKNHYLHDAPCPWAIRPKWNRYPKNDC
jgi:hypothetical protein